MDWSLFTAEPERSALARALICRTAAQGWSTATLNAASHELWGYVGRWRTVFPRGPRDALWFISQVSDASMSEPFIQKHAGRISEVILLRLDQNQTLKPFVAGVMRYDILHPVQALARMQRTARAMFACLGPSAPPVSWLNLTGLNLAYTLVVVLWLADRTRGGRLTRAIVRTLDPVFGAAPRP